MARLGGGPRSFLTLIWLGFACVALPLVLALIDAGVFAGRFARQSTLAVERASRAASGARLLAAQVLSLERRARQFWVLRESELLEDYSERKKAIQGTISRLRPLLDDPEQGRRLDRIVEIDEGIQRYLESIPHRTEVDEAILGRFREIDQLAREVMEASDRLSVEKAERLRVEARKAQQRLFWEALALLPLTFAVTALFAWLLSRPVRAINEAIRRIGTGDFSSPIEVRGPRELRALGERLDWLRRRLAELEAEKSRFLAQMSHELRTPLTAIREGGEILREGVVGELTQQQGEVLAIVRENSVRLQRLIENLLRYSVHRARDPQHLRGRVDLAAVVERVLVDHKPAILAKGLDLETHIDPGWVEGDADRLRTIVDNLIANAVKFTPATGTVRVSVQTEGDAARVEVCDTGPGIPPQERRLVLAPFYRGSASPPSCPEGSGLGLAIVAEHATELGAEVEVGEGPEGGARFQVRFPAVGRPRAQ